MGRRLPIAVALLALVLSGTAAAAKPRSWAAPEIRAVTSAGLMGDDVASFRADDPLTAQALEDLAFELQQRLAPPPPEEEPVYPATDPTVPVDPTAPVEPEPLPVPAPKVVANPTRSVTLAELDRRLVQALGLGKAAYQFATGARAAGLKVPTRFGSEVVARLLGLRLNHPAKDDALELLPGDPATRAETAYSVARILAFSGWEVAGVQSLADSFALPALTDWQKRILTTALGKVGMPYVWGGESDGAQTAFGVSSRGGYDCSGFVWRVYKTQPYSGAPGLGSVLRGRTTYQMSGEVPKSQRIALERLQPADVIFFGDRGPASKPAQVGHMGIYVGNGWFVHSSGNGVALARLEGWYARSFAWGRRPLAEDVGTYLFGG